MNRELIERAGKVESSEELGALMAENGIEISPGCVRSLYDRIKRSGEVEDDELSSVSGGGCGSSSSGGSSTREEDSGYGLKTGDRAHILWGELCPCGCENVEILYCSGGYGTAAERYMTRCLECGSEVGHWAYELKKI